MYIVYKCLLNNRLLALRYFNIKRIYLNTYRNLDTQINIIMSK